MNPEATGAPIIPDLGMEQRMSSYHNTMIKSKQLQIQEEEKKIEKYQKYLDVAAEGWEQDQALLNQKMDDFTNEATQVFKKAKGNPSPTELRKLNRRLAELESSTKESLENKEFYEKTFQAIIKNKDADIDKSLALLDQQYKQGKLGTREMDNFIIYDNPDLAKASTDLAKGIAVKYGEPKAGKDEFGNYIYKQSAYYDTGTLNSDIASSIMADPKMRQYFKQNPDEIKSFTDQVIGKLNLSSKYQIRSPRSSGSGLTLNFGQDEEGNYSTNSVPVRMGGRDNIMSYTTVPAQNVTAFEYKGMQISPENVSVVPVMLNDKKENNLFVLRKDDFVRDDEIGMYNLELGKDYVYKPFIRYLGTNYSGGKASGKGFTQLEYTGDLRLAMKNNKNWGNEKDAYVMGSVSQANRKQSGGQKSKGGESKKLKDNEITLSQLKESFPTYSEDEVIKAAEQAGYKVIKD